MAVNVSREIKEVREILGFTQKELADKLGVARNTVVRWEIGQRHPSLVNYLKIKIMAEEGRK